MLRRRSPAAVAVAALLGANDSGRVNGECEVAHLVNPAAPSDAFGVSISVDEGMLLVGDPYAGQGGVAYAFRRDGLLWRFETAITPPAAAQADLFGQAVALRGDVAVIGAPWTGEFGAQPGAAFVYRFSPDLGRWAFEVELLASDGDASDLFGWSVAVDGDTAIVGASHDEGSGPIQSGSAYVFRYDGATWVEEAKVTPPDPQPIGLFGQSLAIMTDTALVGAPGTYIPYPQAGAAYIFRRDGSKWALQAELTAFEPAGYQWFGASVSLADNTAVVGAPQDDGAIGAAYVFARREHR